MYKNIACLYLNITVLNTCEQIHSFKKKKNENSNFFVVKRTLNHA